MSSTYTQDVEFNSGFDALQTPVHMFTAAALCGAVAARIDRPFRYMDLACGNGLTLALLADAYPHGEFVGIDINPDHVARAKERADRASLANVTFHQGDVQDLDAGTYAKFDYVAASGVYSWIDPERRAKLRQFVAGIANDGGLIYLDYSSQPGMAQTAPLYRILRDLGKNFAGSSAERLTQAARAADQMRTDGARFFEYNPIAAARLETILQNPPEDEAHEVFNLQENGFWSSEVISDMEGDGCNFLASAGLHQNLPLLTGRPDAMEPFADLSVAQQQASFDILWNVHQRRDIFVKGAISADEAGVFGSLSTMPFYVMPGALSLERRRSLAKPLPHFDFGSAAASVFAECAADADNFGDLFTALAAKGQSAGESRELARHFMAARLLSVAPAAPALVGEAQDYEMPSTLNRNTLAEDIGAEHARPFASPVAGSRVLLPLKDRLYLWGLLGMDLGAAWDKMADLQGIFRDPQNNPLAKDGFCETITNSLPSFRQHIVPELVRLQILQPI